MTDEMVMEIVRASATGLTEDCIASAYDISLEDVRKIISENGDQIDQRKEDLQ